MLVSKAYAQATDALSKLEGQIPSMPETASAGELLFTNLAVVVVLIFLFYILLILPQQRRFKDHAKMLDDLKKGDKVVTGGGLIGTVEKVVPEKDEIIVNLGDMKVTALRSTIHTKHDPRLDSADPANSNKEDKKAEAAKKEDTKKKDKK